MDASRIPSRLQWNQKRGVILRDGPVESLRHVVRGYSFALLIVIALPLCAFDFAAAQGEADAVKAATSETETAGAKPLSLEESIVLALKNNPSLNTAQRRKLAAQQKVPQAVAQFGPNVTATASHTLQGPIVSFPSGPGSTITVFPESRNDAIVSLNQTLYAGASIPASKRSASLGVQAADFNLEEVRQGIITRTKTAYYQVLRALRLKEVADETVGSAEEHLRIARASFDAGTVARFDVLRSEVELADSRQSQLAADNGVELANAAFNNVLGRDMGTPVSLQPVEVGEMKVPDSDASLQTALRERPEILATERAVWIAKENVKLQQAGREPAVNLSASYHRQTTTGFSSDYQWSAALALSVPVFDRGLAKARVREAREQVAEDASLLEEIKQNIALEVRRSVLNVREAKQRIETAAKAVEAAEESMRIADLRYQEGVGTQLEVTDARLALNRARTNHTHALYDYLSSYASWEQAVGQSKSAPVP